MSSPDAPSGLRALLVEDSENDALLLAEELRRGGYEPVCERVSTPGEMELALAEASARGEPWQVVLSDYYMPLFRAPDALALLRKLGYDTPFIVVSGKIGEDAAVTLMQADGLRGAIFELRLKEGLGQSFVSSLETLVDLNRRMARDRYELQLDVEDGFPLTLSEKAGQELTRIIQEALTNARRHSEARRVEVRLWLAGDLACAEVADDGRGFDAAQTRIGMGQHSMRHRALELGGDLQVESEPGRGTRVRFHAPLSRLIGA